MEMLIKSRIKTHQRRLPTGQSITIREHDDSRTKKQDQPSRRHGARTTQSPSKKGANRIASAAPVAVGQFLEKKGIPISDIDSKTDGFSISKYEGKTILRYHSHGKAATKPKAIEKHITAVNDALAEQGLTATQIGTGGQYIIHKLAGSGLQDLPKQLREKCERGEPGKGGEIKLSKTEVTTLLEKGRVGFISAGKNPSSTSTDELGLSEKDITSRGDSLQKELIAMGLKFTKVHGKYGEEEDSFMVMIPDAERSEMVNLGRKYNQDSIIYSDHNKNEMIFTTGSNTGQRHTGSGFKYLDSKTADFYTEIDTGQDKPLKFMLKFDFGKLEKVAKSIRMLIKSKLGSRKPSHKYTKREGAPGKYQYTYPGEDSGTLFAKPDTKVTTETITIANIVPDPDQPRKHFDKVKLQELGRSITINGLIQDIAIRPDPGHRGHYVIIAGERRWRAMKLEGIEITTAKVYHTMDPAALASIQVAENVGREQMNPIEEAVAYKKLFDVGYSFKQIADRVSTSETTVKYRMELLMLIPALQELVKHGSLPISQAGIIARAELKTDYQLNVLKRLNLGKLSNQALAGIVGKYESAQTQVVTSRGVKPKKRQRGKLRKAILKASEFRGSQLPSRIRIGSMR